MALWILYTHSLIHLPHLQTTHLPHTVFFHRYSCEITLGLWRPVATVYGLSSVIFLGHYRNAQSPDTMYPYKIFQ